MKLKIEIPILIRRTFAAKQHPPGSPERSILNLDAATSEYTTSRRYLLRRPAVMDDGTPHPTQKFWDADFTTKMEAEAALRFFQLHPNQPLP